MTAFENIARGSSYRDLFSQQVLRRRAMINHLNMLSVIRQMFTVVAPHRDIFPIKSPGLSRRGANTAIGIFILTLSALSFQLCADEVEKVLFLVFESGEVVASNTRAGRFDRLKLHAEEHILDYQVANATAVVITNRRFAAYGVLSGGWRSKRIKAGETPQSLEVEDYSATLVTSDRILNFSGRSGAWSETRRRVQ